MSKPKKNEEYNWTDKKRTFFGLPLSFTRYCLSDDKLIVKSGFLNLKEEEIRLYRIMDVTLKRSLRERLFGLGTIHCCSADKSSPEFDIVHIKNSLNVKNFLSDEVERERKERRIGIRELMDTDNDGFDMDGDMSH